MIRELQLADALYVVQHMRQRDRDGFRAALGELSDDELAVGRFQAYGPAWVMDVNGAPAAIGGIHLVNAWTGFMWLVVADGVPPGLGAPIYAKLDADIAAALMGINAVKGVEIGEGFAAAALASTAAARIAPPADGTDVRGRILRFTVRLNRPS